VLHIAVAHCTMHKAQEEQEEIVEKLIAMPLQDKDPVNNNKSTPLHYAAQNGNLKITDAFET